MLRAIVEAENEEFVRAGFVGFGPSSIDFELVFDVRSDDFEETFTTRHNVGLTILERFRDEGILFAYPTQTTFTAAPDGSYVMPYAPLPQPVSQGRTKG
jgi:small-conductance mechanosensitive channel